MSVLRLKEPKLDDFSIKLKQHTRNRTLMNPESRGFIVNAKRVTITLTFS